MKHLLFLTAVLFSQQIFSQQPHYYDLKKFKNNNDAQVLPLDLSRSYKPLSKDSLAKVLRNLKQAGYSQSFGTLQLTQVNGNKVYALPQDNMACVVPDLTQFNMPVAGTNIKITGMPPEFKKPTPNK